MIAHKSLNCSNSVVKNWELARTDPEEIKVNVLIITDAHRITVKKGTMRRLKLILQY